MLFHFNTALFGCFMFHIMVRFVLYLLQYVSQRETWWGLIDVFCKCFSDALLKSNKEPDRATSVTLNWTIEACGTSSHTVNALVLKEAAVWCNLTPKIMWLAVVEGNNVEELVLHYTLEVNIASVPLLLHLWTQLLLFFRFHIKPIWLFVYEIQCIVKDQFPGFVPCSPLQEEGIWFS